jgi:hypothetical protein
VRRCGFRISTSKALPRASTLCARLTRSGLAVPRRADVVVLVIEFIIPADKYAVRLEAPPAPPAPPSLPAPSEPDPTVGPNTDPQLSATRDAALRRGGLLQSFGITMGGMQDDLVDMTTFLEAGTLHVHLARSAARTGGCSRVCRDEEYRVDSRLRRQTAHTRSFHRVCFLISIFVTYISYTCRIRRYTLYRTDTVTLQAVPGQHAH